MHARTKHCDFRPKWKKKQMQTNHFQNRVWYFWNVEMCWKQMLRMFIHLKFWKKRALTKKRCAKIDSIIRNLNAQHNLLLFLSLYLSFSLLRRLVFAFRSIAIAVAAVELLSPRSTYTNCARRSWEHKSHVRLYSRNCEFRRRKLVRKTCIRSLSVLSWRKYRCVVFLYLQQMHSEENVCRTKVRKKSFISISWFHFLVAYCGKEADFSFFFEKEGIVWTFKKRLFECTQKYHNLIFPWSSLLLAKNSKLIFSYVFERVIFDGQKMLLNTKRLLEKYSNWMEIVSVTVISHTGSWNGRKCSAQLAYPPMRSRHKFAVHSSPLCVFGQPTITLMNAKLIAEIFFFFHYEFISSIPPSRVR